jgi:signal transduction histidine kinase/ActR/RegA family two-component response regulator
MADFCASLDGAAAGFIAEEAFSAHGLDLLISALQRQPVWSDVPLILLTTRAMTTEAVWQFVQDLEAVGNVTLLERPFTRPILLSTLQGALRARRHQHEIRQLHEELEWRVAERTAALEQQTQQLRHEVAERQRMQEALFQQEKLAALGTLLANVAHELNNPLTVAAMQLDILQEEAGSEVWADDDLKMLRQALDRCQSVVQSFLSLARQQSPTRSAVALNTVIGDVLVLLEHALEADGIIVERDLAEDLPMLWADPHQLHHVVANLITNAHHALRQTAVPRHLKLSTAANADYREITLEVVDSGPGILHKLQRRIFDPFFTTKAQGEGSGLGLSLCRNIVESHEGIISIASEPGQGTTAYVTLPVAASDRPSEEAPAAAAAPSQSQGRSILLIDDELGMQKALRRLLQRRGHDVTTANNGREGLTALEARSYEVILCDMRMPDLDGPGFYRELEQRHPDLLSRMIFLTGDTLTPEAKTFFAQIDRPHLVKPFKIQEVSRMIQQVVEAR